MPEETLENLELVERARRGDAGAFAGLIARHERACLAIAYAKLRDAEAAGDVVQEAFLKAWQNIKSLGNAASFGGWLAQIVRNLAIDAQRKSKPTATLEAVPEASADADADPPTVADKRERAEAIEAALSQLDDTTREIVTLRYFDGLPSREIGGIVGMSPAAVDMRLSRARNELRVLLEKSLHPLAVAGACDRQPAER